MKEPWNAFERHNRAGHKVLTESETCLLNQDSRIIHAAQGCSYVARAGGPSRFMWLSDKPLVSWLWQTEPEWWAEHKTGAYRFCVQCAFTTHDCAGDCEAAAR